MLFSTFEESADTAKHNMRNSGQIRNKSKENKFWRLAKKVDELLLRVEQLEQKVFFNLQSVLADKTRAKTRGRKPKLAASEVLKRRDALVLWIEENWPELELAIRKARTPEVLMKAVIEARAEGTHPFQPEFYRNPERFKTELWAFLKSGRYRGNPRDLAGAMAGLPEQSWKRSFDISCRHRSAVFKHKRAYRDYLRRKFPQRLKELLRAKTQEEAKMILNRSRTKDQHYVALKKSKENVLDLLVVGVPRSAAGQ